MLTPNIKIPRRSDTHLEHRKDTCHSVCNMLHTIYMSQALSTFRGPPPPEILAVRAGGYEPGPPAEFAQGSQQSRTISPQGADVYYLDIGNLFALYIYIPSNIAHQFHGHATPHLGNNLRHPPENFPEPRNPFPGTDPIMDTRRKVSDSLCLRFFYWI